jgi:nucleoside-diphosphate-sugar epimerase
MARYLITGVAGFIGSTLAHTLLEQGHDVVGIDNLVTGRMENLAGVENEIRFFQADIRNTEELKKACHGVDFILHQAALASVPRSVSDPLASHQANIDGTMSVLLAAREAGVRRIVYAASSSAYGDQPTQPKHEGMQPQPRSPYAVQKLTGEYYMQAFSNVYGMETVCLRYFNIFGPRQAADSPYSGVIAQFVSRMMRGEIPTINGDGLTSRDFTFISNAVQANLLACKAPKAMAAGQVYNIGTGQAHTLNELYAVIAEVLGFRAKPKYGPTRAGDVKHSLASIEKAAGDLGYTPDTDFRACIARTVAWYVSQAEHLVESLVA